MQGVGVGDLCLPSVGTAGVGFIGQGFVIAESDARVGCAAAGWWPLGSNEDGLVPQVMERGSVAGGGVGEEQCQRGSRCEDATKRGYPPPAFVSRNTTERANARGLVTKRLRTRFMMVPPSSFGSSRIVYHRVSVFGKWFCGDVRENFKGSPQSWSLSSSGGFVVPAGNAVRIHESPETPSPPPPQGFGRHTMAKPRAKAAPTSAAAPPACPPSARAQSPTACRSPRRWR